jgi:predicted secreted hydrolase
VSSLTRRAWGALALAAAAQPAAAAGRVRYPVLRPGVALSFPADHGAHPEQRTEWWYVTGWLRTAEGGDLGFQVTFFRTRPDVDQANPSAFSPRQVLFAHAALSDPRTGRLTHDQRVARAGFGLAQAKVGDADIVLDDWRFWREADGRFRTRVGGDGFALDLAFAPTQPPLLQGRAGFSRKGPGAEQASYYYSLPHLAVSGTVRRGRKAERAAREERKLLASASYLLGRGTA